MTPSAISHQIRILEDWLGVALFRRETRAVKLTAAGRTFLTSVTRAFDGLSKSAMKLKGGEAKTKLFVTALPLFTQSWLIPRLGRFVDLHPEIEVTITTENKVNNLTNGRSHIGIRYLRSPTPGLFCR